MAILKNIPIHASGTSQSKSAGISKAVSNVVDYIDDDKKNAYIKKMDDIDRVLSYDINNEKTLMDKTGVQKSLVSYIGTSKSTISDDFDDLMEKYYETHKRRNYTKENEKGETKKEIMSFHFIQSFEQDSSELNPELAHEIGVEWLSEMGYIGVVSTHMDTDNVHNHILLCPFPQQETEKRLIMNRTTWREACELNDEICQAHGLETLEKDRMTKGRHREGERDGSAVHREKRARQAGNSYKEQLRRDIDSVIPRCRSWSDFVYEMESSEWEIRNSGTGKTVTAVAMSNEKHRARLNRLGEGYSKEDIINRIKRNREIEAEIRYNAEDQIRLRAIDQAEANELDQGDRYSDIEDKLRQETKDKIEKIMNRRYVIHNSSLSNYFDSRWSATGRRRSELEMIIIELINLLKRIRDAIIEAITHAEEIEANAEMIRQYNYRIEQVNKEIVNLKKHLEIVSKYGSLQDLKKEKKELGKKLNRAKKELASMKQRDTYNKYVLQLLISYSKSKDLLSYIKEELIPKYTTAENRKTIAEYFPATPEQRKDLYLLLNKEGVKYRIDGKWDSLNYDETREIIEFLKGKSNKQPERLIPKYQKSEMQSMYYAKNKEKEESWARYLETIPEGLRDGVDRLYGTIIEMNKLGIDPESNIDDLMQRIKEFEDIKKKKIREIESYKNEYINIIKAEKSIISAQKMVEQESSLIENRNFAMDRNVGVVDERNKIRKRMQDKDMRTV